MTCLDGFDELYVGNFGLVDWVAGAPGVAGCCFVVACVCGGAVFARYGWRRGKEGCVRDCGPVMIWWWIVVWSIVDSASISRLFGV